MKVAELQDALLGRFPAEDAEEWDHVGLSVGDSEAEVTGILCALDPTPCAVEAAAERGANVLLTHHPVYLKAPSAFTPHVEDSVAGATLWAAIAHGVNLIALHTNLDRSEEALRFLASELGLVYLGRATREGYGALLDGRDLAIGALGGLLRERLGAWPILWSASIDLPPRHIHKTIIDSPRSAMEATSAELGWQESATRTIPAGKVAYLSGSAGELALDAAARGASTIVCGEQSYHRLMELINKKTPDNDNLSVIVIGHDVSELPYASLLREVARELAPDVAVRVLEEGIHWSAP